MRFDELSRTEKVEYKRQVMADFMEHGMDEREALVNYVFCVNPHPLNWLEYRYCIGSDEARSLKESGMSKYERNGGRHGCRGMLPSEGRRTCHRRRALVPE